MSEARHLEPAPPVDDDGAPAPPNDIAAERACLGAMLRGDREAIDAVTTTITGADYYQPKHELIHDAIVWHYSRGTIPDPLVVNDRLRDTGDLKRAGGTAYLHELTQGVVVTANADYYADIVHETATRRRLIQLGTRITQTGYSLGLAGAEYTPESLIESARQQLDTIPLRPAGVDEDTTTHPWTPVDFDAILDGDLEAPKATALARRDGKHLLYPYAVHSISGEPGSLKTWIAMLAAVQELEQGNPVVMIDFEDRPQSVATRLLQIGARPEHLRDRHLWRYIRPDIALDDNGARHLTQAVTGATLAIIDGVTEAMSLHGMSVNDNDDVARYIHMLPKRVADLGPATLQIDHVTKDSDSRGRYAIGGQHKLAAVTGTAMKAVVVRSGGKGEHAVVKVVLDKDKHGDVGPTGLTVAEFHLDDTQPGYTSAWLDHPTTSVDENGQFRPTILMRRVSDYLLGLPRAASMRDIRQGVKGNSQSIADAVDALVREGHIRVEDGPRGAVMHHLVTAFEEPS